MVEQGMGCAFCLDGLADTGPTRNLTFRPLDPPVNVHLVAVCKKYQPLSPAARLFLERLVAEAKESAGTDKSGTKSN